MALYIFVTLVIFIVVSVTLILYFNYSIETINHKKEILQSTINDLKNQNAFLEDKIYEKEMLLVGKKEELMSLTDKLGQIETLMGLSDETKELTVQQRMELATLTSVDIAEVFELIPNGSPIEYNGVTSKYGYRIHPITRKKEFHPGIDLKAARKTPIYATADGVVNFAGNHKDSGYGKLIILDHSYAFKTFYGHLNKIVVKSKQIINKGDLIGYTGNTGRSNGPHLHYEVRFTHQTLNPFWFIKWEKKNYAAIFEQEKKVPWQSLIKAITKPSLNNMQPQLSQKALVLKETFH